MKAIITILVSIGLGIAAGYAFFTFESSFTAEPFYSGEWESSSDKGDNYSPSAKLSATSHDYGAMLTNRSHECSIDVANNGRSELEILLTDFPAGMTANIAPKQVVRVKPQTSFTLIFDAIPFENDAEFSKAFILETSDPDQPELFLQFTGQTKGGLIIDKDKTTFSRENLGSDTVIEFLLVSFEQDEFQITDTVLSRGDKEGWFDVDAIEMTEDQLSGFPGAKSGKAVQLKVTEELPKSVRQLNIELTTDCEGYQPLNVSVFFSK